MNSSLPANSTAHFSHDATVSQIRSSAACRTEPRYFVGVHGGAGVSALREFADESSLADFVAALGVPPSRAERAGGYLHQENSQVMVIPVGSGAALIDAEDYALVSGYKWRTNSCGYAVSNHSYGGVDCRQRMHRLLMMVGPSWEVDHKNGIKLDNRKSNLRIVLREQNNWNTRTPAHNTSGVKGLRWDARRELWCAGVQARHKRHARAFKKFDDAVQWLRATREALHGEFACHS